jgi:hypothetical protein
MNKGKERDVPISVPLQKIAGSETLRSRLGVILDDYEALAFEKRNQFEIFKKEKRLGQTHSSCGKLRTSADFYTVSGCL